MKWVFTSLTGLILAMVVHEANQPANEPTVTIERRPVPYRFVRVWNQPRPGREGVVVGYADPDTQIDYLETVSVAKANEILALHAAGKTR